MTLCLFDRAMLDAKGALTRLEEACVGDPGVDLEAARIDIGIARFALEKLEARYEAANEKGDGWTNDRRR